MFIYRSFAEQEVKCNGDQYAGFNKNRINLVKQIKINGRGSTLSSVNLSHPSPLSLRVSAVLAGLSAPLELWKVRISRRLENWCRSASRT